MYVLYLGHYLLNILNIIGIFSFCVIIHHEGINDSLDSIIYLTIIGIFLMYVLYLGLYLLTIIGIFSCLV